MPIKKYLAARSEKKRTEADTKLKQAKVKELKAENRAMRGGQVSGLSGMAGSSVAGGIDPKKRQRATETYKKVR